MSKKKKTSETTAPVKERRDSMYPQSIKTDRLTVRRIREEDWQDIRDIWIDFSASDYAEYDTPKKTDDDSVMDIVSRWAECSDSDEHIFYAVCLEGKVIGFFAFNIQTRKKPNDIYTWYYLGYCFHSAYHHKGYAFARFRAIEEAFSKCEDRAIVIAGTAMHNFPSVRFLESVGFKKFDTDLQYFHTDEHGKPILFVSHWFTKYM